MGRNRWSEEEVLGLSARREEVLNRLAEGLTRQGSIVFSAKFGFGTPRIDLVAVDSLRSIIGYVVKFPVEKGAISTVPYYQGFGETVFLPDQMLDTAYLIVPDFEVSENLAFTRSPNPEYRIQRAAYEAGLCLFDRDFNIKVVRDPKGSLAKQFWRLKLELLDCISAFAEFTVPPGKEGDLTAWKDWVTSEIAAMGDKMLLNEDAGRAIVKKILEEKNYHKIRLDLAEGETSSEPRPIPVYNVSGTGFYLGDDKDFSMQISRVSGIVLRRNY
ncbi:MAG TPA: hypothetical protein ENH13_00190 [Euryarchaeota archaeon]|nr:hypothetical protein [Euryarchaeota archaeon]